MKIFGYFTVAVCLAATGCVSAGGDAMETYSYALDVGALEEPGGAEKVYADIRRQASRWCAYHTQPPRHDTRGERACREAAERDAVVAVASPRLDRVFVSESGGALLTARSAD